MIVIFITKLSVAITIIVQIIVAMVAVAVESFVKVYCIMPHCKLLVTH